MSSGKFTTLFLDIRGVLLTNGWDQTARLQAAERFQLDYADVEERHHLTYDTYMVSCIPMSQPHAQN